MLDMNKEIKFMYRADEGDDVLENGLIATLTHIEGRKLASIEDVMNDDCKCHSTYYWGADGEYLFVSSGLFQMKEGSYSRIWG